MARRRRSIHASPSTLGSFESSSSLGAAPCFTSTPESRAAELARSCSPSSALALEPEASASTVASHPSGGSVLQACPVASHVLSSKPVVGPDVPSLLARSSAACKRCRRAMRRYSPSPESLASRSPLPLSGATGGAAAVPGLFVAAASAAAAARRSASRCSLRAAADVPSAVLALLLLLLELPLLLLL